LVRRPHTCAHPPLIGLFSWDACTSSIAIKCEGPARQSTMPLSGDAGALEVGVSPAYDLGRKEGEDYGNLMGISDEPAHANGQGRRARTWVTSRFPPFPF
jgi:hypothetical protein